MKLYELYNSPVNETLKKVKGKWALVSKHDPKKVLQYYHGSGHPSKEWVSKVERRVHSFGEGLDEGSLKDNPKLQQLHQELRKKEQDRREAEFNAPVDQDELDAFRSGLEKSIRRSSPSYTPSLVKPVKKQNPWREGETYLTLKNRADKLEKVLDARKRLENLVTYAENLGLGRLEFYKDDSHWDPNETWKDDYAAYQAKLNKDIAELSDRIKTHRLVHKKRKRAFEELNEEVGGNYLYHATDARGLKGILSSGQIRSAAGPQTATQAQTKHPTVSVTRDWNYASGGKGATAQGQGSIGRDAILVLDRDALEHNFKTLGTSQSSMIKGLGGGDAGYSANLRAKKVPAQIDTNNNKRLDPDEIEVLKKKGYDDEIIDSMKRQYFAAKSGGEYEEAVVVPKGSLPIKSVLVGFWVNPKSELTNDPSIMNDPRRLEKSGPGSFSKAQAEKSLTEGMTFSPAVEKPYTDREGKPSTVWSSRDWEKLIKEPCWVCDGTGVDKYHKHACDMCDGEGEIEEWRMDAPSLSVSNSNGYEIQRMLGLDPDYSGMIHNKDLPQFIRHLIKLKNKGSAHHTEEPSINRGEMGKISRDDNVIGIGRRGPTMIDMGRSQSQVDRYIDELLKLMRFAQEHGASVHWG